MKHSDAPRTDIYTRITDQIIRILESGVKPWIQPWHAAHAAGFVSRPLRHNGQPYAGINVLTLWASAMERGYAAPIWMTFKQALELGAAVRKGEKGSPVVYASSIQRNERDEKTGEDVERDIPFLKAYTVFNVEQIDGLPAHYTAKPADAPRNPDARLANVDAFFAALGADVRHAGSTAFYAPGPDYIQLPAFESFLSAEGYYATLGHECVHWTRHKSRLDRDFGQKRFGDEFYAREELVAELGAAFLCADLGIACEDREDHAAYIGHWLSALKNDKRCIFAAAAHAQRAVDFLHSRQANVKSDGGVAA
jgi:antirestriction protein ArdC